MLDRRIRVVWAASAVPRATVGIANSRAAAETLEKSPSLGVIGNTPRSTANTLIRRMPRKKFGIESPMNASTVAAWSFQVYCSTALM
jgi:hypothetical protein